MNEFKERLVWILEGAIALIPQEDNEYTRGYVDAIRLVIESVKMMEENEDEYVDAERRKNE